MLDFKIKTDTCDEIWRNILNQWRDNHNQFPLTTGLNGCPGVTVEEQAELWQMAWKEYCRIESEERPIRLARFELNQTSK